MLLFASGKVLLSRLQGEGGGGTQGVPHISLFVTKVLWLLLFLVILWFDLTLWSGVGSDSTDGSKV